MKAVYEQVISDLAFAVSKLELNTDNDTDDDRHTKRQIARVLKKALVKLQAMSTHDLLKETLSKTIRFTITPDLVKRVVELVINTINPFSPAFRRAIGRFPPSRKVLIEHAAQSEFLDPAGRDIRNFLRCGIDVVIVWIEPEQFHAVLSCTSRLYGAAFRSLNTAISRQNLGCEDFIQKILTMALGCHHNTVMKL